MNQAELKKKVIQAMGKNGMINHLQALYIATVAEEVQETDMELLKPYRSIRVSEEYNLAAQIVLQYLSKKDFQLSKKAAVNESDGKLQEGKDAPKSLKIKDGEVWIHSLLKIWEKTKDGAPNTSREFMHELIQRRLDELDENEPETAPGPRAKPRQKANKKSMLDKSRMSVNPDVPMVQSDESTPGVEAESDVSINADLDSVDLGDDSMQMKTPNGKKPGRQVQSIMSPNEPSDFPEDDIDFDADSPVKEEPIKASKKPQQKKQSTRDQDFDEPSPPKKNVPSKGNVQKVESDDEDIDVDFDEPSPPKKNVPAKGNVQKIESDDEDVDVDFDEPSPPKKNVPAKGNVQKIESDDEDVDVDFDEPSPPKKNVPAKGNVQKIESGDDFDAPTPPKKGDAGKPPPQDEDSDFGDVDVDLGVDDDFDAPSPPKKSQLVPEKGQNASDYSDVPLLDDTDDSPIKKPKQKDSSFDAPVRPTAATQPRRPGASPVKASGGDDFDDEEDIVLDQTNSLDDTLGTGSGKKPGTTRGKGFVPEYSDDFDKPAGKSPTKGNSAAGDDDLFDEQDVDIDLGFDDDDDPPPQAGNASTNAAENLSDFDDVDVSLSNSDDL